MRRVLTFLLIALSCSQRGEGKIVSLAPSADEIIVALGGKLAGVSTYSKVKDAPVVGDLINPDYERIASLRPDVVILVLPMQERVERRLKELGIRTYDFSPESVEELLDEIRKLGKMVGKEEEAERYVDSIRKVVSSIKPSRKFTFYVEVSSKPVFVAGEGTYISDVIERFGGKNVFSKGYMPVSTETVLAKDPDIVFTIRSVGDRIGFRSCVVELENDYLSPGLSIFPLVKLLKEKIDSCMAELEKRA